MTLKKINWFFKRHPALYKMRFRLLSRNSDISGIANECYNKTNAKEDIPDYFYKINDGVFKDGKPTTDIDIVKAIVIWIDTNIKGGRGLSEPSEKSLRLMIDGEGGVCSDYVQAFNNFCVINDIKVREWGTTRIPFNKNYGGHSFNEFFSKELQQWVMVDISWNTLFLSKEGNYIDVANFFTAIRAGEQLQYASISGDEFIEVGNLNRNYLPKGTTPFLICNYSNKVYDKALILGRPILPIFVIHFIVLIFGKSYFYKFPLDNYKELLK